MANISITGRLQDLQPSKAKPVLELAFGKQERPHLPPEHKDQIVLILDGVRWRGTIGLKSGNTYVHTQLQHGTRRKRVTELMMEMGLAEGASLQFEVEEPGTLRLVGILDRGAWRPGGHPKERSDRAPAPRRQRIAKRPAGSNET